MSQERYTNSVQNFVDNINSCLRIQDDKTRVMNFIDILGEFYIKIESPEKYNIHELIKEDPVLVKEYALFKIRLNLAINMKIFEKEKSDSEYQSLIYDLFTGMYEEAFLDFHESFYIKSQDIDCIWLSILSKGIVKHPVATKIKKKLEEHIALQQGQFIA